MSEYKLENWSVCLLSDSIFLAPEAKQICLQGLRSDDKMVRTSPVKEIDGKNITTKSGSVYVLGTPHPEYVKWCDENGHAMDPLNPIRKRT